MVVSSGSLVVKGMPNMSNKVPNSCGGARFLLGSWYCQLILDHMFEINPSLVSKT